MSFNFIPAEETKLMTAFRPKRFFLSGQLLQTTGGQGQNRLEEVKNRLNGYTQQAEGQR